MKVCSCCKIERSLNMFSKRKGTKDGLRANCKSCNKQYYQANINRIIEYRVKNRDNKKRREEYKLNADKNLEYKRNYKRLNKEKVDLKNKEWRQLNPGKRNANRMKYIADKKQATPSYLTQFDLDYIKHLYIQAKELEKLDGIKRHLDHIIPLQGETVCGLHIPQNLQILTAEENMIKSNKLLGV